MTSVLSNSQLTENERSTNRHKRNVVAPRQPGRSGLSQKHFTEPVSKSRKPLADLDNSSRLQSTSHHKPSKHKTENVQIKPALKPSRSAKSVTCSSTKTSVSSEKVSPEEFPDIESFPSKISTEWSPFVPPSYFKTLTDKLKSTTILPSLPDDYLNMDSLTSVTLDLQERPTTFEPIGPLIEYDASSCAVDGVDDIFLTPVDLPDISNI